MKKHLFIIAVLCGILTACATPTEVIISQMPGYSSAPDWIMQTGGKNEKFVFLVGTAEADGEALSSAVVKLAEREARRGFAVAIQSEIESFARDELGMDKVQSEQVAQETVKLKANGIFVEKTYWQKTADVSGAVRIKAFAYATIPVGEYNNAIKRAKDKAKAVSEEVKKKAEEKWKEDE